MEHLRVESETDASKARSDIRPDSRQARMRTSAARARRASTIIIAVAALTAIGAVIGNAVYTFSEDPNFGIAGTPFRFKLANFLQSAAYSIGIPLIAIAGAMWLRMQADRTELEADDLDASGSRLREDQILTVDFSHPTAPVLPPQGSIDDSLWRPPDGEAAADNPWHRS